MSNCPCSSGHLYEACCKHFHEGEPAPSPEALVRSRFSALVRKNADYLLRSWHPSTRPDQLDLTDSPAWTGLWILLHVAQNDRGRVHFRAVHRTGGAWGYMEEDASFVREQGAWLYVAGETRAGTLMPDRNEPCPCGSRRKYKACCALAMNRDHNRDGPSLGAVNGGPP